MGNIKQVKSSLTFIVQLMPSWHSVPKQQEFLSYFGDEMQKGFIKAYRNIVKWEWTTYKMVKSSLTFIVGTLTSFEARILKLFGRKLMHSLKLFLSELLEIISSCFPATSLHCSIPPQPVTNTNHIQIKGVVQISTTSFIFPIFVCKAWHLLRNVK